MASLAAALRARIGERAVLTCLGASAFTAVPAAAAARATPSPCPPAALPIWLLVAGRAIDTSAASRALGPVLDDLRTLGIIIDQPDGTVRATVALAALGSGILVCDPVPVPVPVPVPDLVPDSVPVPVPVPDPDHLPWPDDSSLHLVGALPHGNLGAWLDVGTGAAIAPLAAGPRAARVRATDINPRALRHAALGARLSDRSDLVIATADLLDGAGTDWDLVTFNAPIPADRITDTGDDTASIWRRGPIDLIDRFWAAAGDHVARDGEVLTHTAIDADPWRIHVDRPGAIAIARYTPPDHPGFAITRWRPHAPRARHLIDITLDRRRPYITRADLDRAAD